MGDALNREVAAAVAQGGTVKYHDNERAVIDVTVKAGVVTLFLAILTGIVTGFILAGALIAAGATLLGIGLGAALGAAIIAFAGRARTSTWELAETDGRVEQRKTQRA